ncbi:DUF1835 domain-containing protein [Terrihabitans sp. B22-R8]|uniref:DUF1835 domain-containing protein n=1 Tax=Terrihabitans sp. B22-R8 TaxID=3425128 RepID=UPI00403C6A43
MRLIVTNGDIAVQKLRAAGFAGDILPWRDVLHDGPVPDEEGLERLSELRAAFLSEEFGVPRDEVALSFAERDTKIRDHLAYDRVELWMEHDLYDQLQLMQILHFFADQNRLTGVYLVQAHDHLGTMKAEDLSALAASATTVDGSQFELACHAWRAFTSPDPTALLQFVSHDLAKLPYLKSALLRLLAEFPDPVRGLSLTEERVLRRLEHGPANSGELYRDVLLQEASRFMGDASFFRRLDGLTFVNAPLIEGLSEPFRIGTKNIDDAEDPRLTSGDGYKNHTLKLTEAGHEVLRGHLDHAMFNEVDRWIGGVRLRPALQVRYDRNVGEMIAPR